MFRNRCVKTILACAALGSAVLGVGACSGEGKSADAKAAEAAGVETTKNTVTTKAADGTVVYGETYYGDLPESAPIIALFHQARADGRGEYGPLTEWLNEAGYRAIAWDLRSGGDLFESQNRTATLFGRDPGYCAAFPDLEAALAYTKQAANGAPVVAWGSSYSAALVMRLAHFHPDDLDAVIAASPASGEPMANCLLEEIVDDIQVPALALRPNKELLFTSEQSKLMSRNGIKVHIINYGVHGSSMFVDERSKHDMTPARELITGWLSETLTKEE